MSDLTPLSLGLALRRHDTAGDVLRHADRLRAGRRRASPSCSSSCRRLSLDTVTQNVYEEMASITLLSIPLFILKGAAIGKSPAGRDLYLALHAWMHRIPGGLGIANVFACGLFAAMAGSSPATCSAIGSAGIPEMRSRGYSGRFRRRHHRRRRHARHPAAAVDHHDPLRRRRRAVAGPAVPRRHRSRRAAGRAVLALCGLALSSRSSAAATAIHAGGGVKSAYLDEHVYTLREKVEMLPRVLPFVILLIGVMVALYGGYATPSETAGLGAMLALVLMAVVYRLWRPTDLAPILLEHAARIDHADVHHRHVAALLLRHELPAHQPVGGRVDRRPRPVEVGCC